MTSSFPLQIIVDDVIDCSVLVFDIEGYTTLSEECSLEHTATIIKVLFTPLLNVLVETKAFHFSYSGDGFIAIYHDAISAPYAASQAIAAAISMSEICDSMSQSFSSEGVCEDLKYGVGVRSGPAQLLKIGNRATAIGDTINVASRLQGLTRKCGHKGKTNILIDGNTYRLINSIEKIDPSLLCWKFFDHIKLKGRSKTIETYYKAKE